jgi:hypothetical protein
VEQIQKKLAIQITSDFQNAFTNSPKNNTNSEQGDKLSLAQLTDACLVVSVLEDSKVKIDLLKWFICKYPHLLKQYSSSYGYSYPFSFLKY